MLQQLRVFGLAATIAVTGLVAAAPSASAETILPASPKALNLASLSVGSESAVVHGLACESAGNCTALISIDLDGASALAVAREVNGAWANPVRLGAPSGHSVHAVDATFLACPTQSSCTVLTRGSFGGSDEALMAQQNSGTWSVLSVVDVAGTISNLASASPETFSCYSGDLCVMGGSAVKSDSSKVAWAAVRTAGTWGPVHEVANAEEVTAAACDSAGDCHVVTRGHCSFSWPSWSCGSNVVNGTESWLGDYAIWSGASTFDLGSTYEADRITKLICVGWQSCAGVGRVTVVSSGKTYPAVMNGAYGSFAINAMDPPDNATSGELTAVDCYSANSCVFGGTYDDTFYGKSAFYRLPSQNVSQSVPGMVAHGDTVTSISCSAATHCQFIGTHVTAGKATVWTEANVQGTGWGQPEELVVPSAVANPTSVDGVVDCGTVEMCDVLATYQVHDSGTNTTPTGIYAYSANQAGSWSGGGGGGYNGMSPWMTIYGNTQDWSDPTGKTQNLTVFVYPRTLSGTVLVKFDNGSLVGKCRASNGGCMVRTKKIPFGYTHVNASFTGGKPQVKLAAGTNTWIDYPENHWVTDKSDTYRDHHPVSLKRKGRIVAKLVTNPLTCSANRDVTVVVSDWSSHAVISTRYLHTAKDGMLKSKTPGLPVETYQVTLTAQAAGSCAPVTGGYILQIG